jgi:holo-[acyl-carrier protein] synthase
VVRGLGIDLVELARFERVLARHAGRIEERLFTPAERADCEARPDRSQALAARFAAKEAAMKALGTGWARGIAFRQIEVRRDPSGAPQLLLHEAAARRAADLGVRLAHVSLTHQPGVAAAVVVLED